MYMRSMSLSIGVLGSVENGTVVQGYLPKKDSLFRRINMER